MTPSAFPESKSLTARPQWRALVDHRGQIERRHLRELFAADPSRGERLVVEAAGLYLDYSKNRITDETLRLLLALAEACSLRERIAAMYRGDKINATEERAVLHVALRAPASVRSGEWKGYDGRRIRNVVSIGIGGSDLGPVMAYEALRHYSQRDLTFRFVSNVDSTDFVEATRDLAADETLFIICSKTFTTLETLTNAHTARAWSLKKLGGEEAVARHFV